jgi:hypothetical protein
LSAKPNDFDIMRISYFFCSILLLGSLPTISASGDRQALEAGDGETINWYSPLEAPFTIYGLKWEASQSTYRRLPANNDGDIPPKVDRHADAPAGGQIHFSTNSKRVWIRASMSEQTFRHHGTPVATYGFDVYKREDDFYRFLGITRMKRDELTYTSEVMLQEEAEMNAFVINMPLFNPMDSIEIGISEGSRIEASAPFEGKPPVVIYGTSIVHGSAASRPGMTYPSILSRMLDREVVNLGFAGAARGELKMADLLNEIPGKGLIILDMEANTHDKLKVVLEPFVERIRSTDTTTPILILSRIHLTRDALGEWQARRKELTQFQIDLVQRFRDAGDDKIFFMDGRELIDEEWKWDSTVDGTHPTDLGFSMMAKNLRPVIEAILLGETP